ncbi:hypothetical protein BDB00DRAFT_876221 [Zychaea mexicana]|uniref:uncharacterized protein n=1 Tax=Zychaea mexicana TaxID=64656 RepID=UPI0022FE04B1|nr:uncharacterized protein BDB00DRAFT_876221 [Zychaea mexicana]KAI9489561.1 hypothetical protein BDB00DRAFT_876221 [Zychaea mexicana]
MSQSLTNITDHGVKRKRKKVSLACVFCRRSHMTCDEGRPCQRCIKRSIGHMCHDEPRPDAKKAALNAGENKRPREPSNHDHSHHLHSSQYNNGKLALTFASDSMGDELTVINDFLDDMSSHKTTTSNISTMTSSSSATVVASAAAKITPATSSKDKFFLTAADPQDGKLEDRLNEVINAKYEAGFLKPYNYVSGYARLQRYMDQHMSSSSRQRILNVMGTFRPTFRDVAQALTDVDLILVEEAFERLLLDYDRVFSAMAVPACLWRRTGEIYKGNKEFASLIDVPVEKLRDGKLCIYEIMAEDSTVNYWEKYGNIAFDSRQKAVLTSCLLKHRSKGVLMPCCFSFTIRRDKYNMQVSQYLLEMMCTTIIVGNFLPIEIQP